MRRLAPTRTALKFLTDLQAKQFKQVAGKILSLLTDPAPPDSLVLSDGVSRRADIGEYRIIYRFDQECVYVDLIGKRNDDEVYRRHERR